MGKSVLDLWNNNIGHPISPPGLKSLVPTKKGPKNFVFRVARLTLGKTPGFAAVFTIIFTRTVKTGV